MLNQISGKVPLQSSSSFTRRRTRTLGLNVTILLSLHRALKMDTAVFIGVFLSTLSLIATAIGLLIEIIGLLTPTRSRCFGRSPSTEEMRASGSKCAICYEEYRNPIMLKCSDLHILCELCLIQWFAQSRTCPLCRAQVYCNCISTDLDCILFCHTI